MSEHRTIERVLFVLVALAALCIPCAAQVFITQPPEPDASVAIGMEFAMVGDCGKLHAWLATVQAKYKADVRVRVGNRVIDMTCEEFERRVFGR